MNSSLPLDLDARIDREHAAIERDETDAIRIADRIAAIPGCEAFARRKRSFGIAPNPWTGQGNMTIQSLILRADPALATYLAGVAGKQLPAPDREAAAAEQRWRESAARLEAQTASLRARNEASRSQLSKRTRTITGGWF